MNLQSNQEEGKKPYEPPRLTNIGLRPEEAVLGHCKTAGSINFGGNNCGLIGQCASMGS